MSEGYPRDTKINYTQGVSDVSDKQQLPIIRWVRIDGLNELDNCFSHQVGLVNVIFVTNGGHFVLEGQRHPQAGLVWVFDHMHFLSSFWIR